MTTGKYKMEQCIFALCLNTSLTGEFDWSNSKELLFQTCKSFQSARLKTRFKLQMEVYRSQHYESLHSSAYYILGFVTNP